MGRPLDWVITPGQAPDVPFAIGLLADHAFHRVIADRGYDADYLLSWIAKRKAEKVIPPMRHRKVQREYDRQQYKHRNRIERFFNRIKNYRRIATRFDKTDASYLAMLTIAAILVWLA